jgi:hypothetical protein
MGRRKSRVEMAGTCTIGSVSHNNVEPTQNITMLLAADPSRIANRVTSIIQNTSLTPGVAITHARSAQQPAQLCQGPGQ